MTTRPIMSNYCSLSVTNTREKSENEKALRVLKQAYQLSRGLKERSIRAKASCVLSGAMVPIGELARAEVTFRRGFA